MMKKNVIVSLADANYFPLLNELIDSIKIFKESENLAICILDAGLTEGQKKILLKRTALAKGGTKIRLPDIQKIRSLGFKKKFNLEKGLKKILDL